MKVPMMKVQRRDETVNRCPEGWVRVQCRLMSLARLRTR